MTTPSRKPVVSWTVPQVPLTGADGKITWAWTKWFQGIQQTVNAAFDQQGNFDGTLGSDVGIVTRGATLLVILQHISDTGVVQGPGIDFALPYLNKDTDHILDGTGQPLAGGRVAYAAMVGSGPTAGEVLIFNGTSWTPHKYVTSFPKAVHEWLDSFDASTGLFTASRPDYADLTGLPTLPGTIPPTTHEWLKSYDASTGSFTATQPAFTDISGVATTTQIGTGTPAAGQYVDGATGAWTAIPGGSGITALTGDVTATGPGSAAATLAATAVTPGSYTNANITVDTKGRVTAAANGSAGAGTVTTTGTPATGNLTKFTGATSVSNADLTGDVTTSGTVATTIAANAVTTAKINNAAVTYAKIQNVSASSILLGAGASGSGAAPVEIALGTNLSMSGTTLNAAAPPATASGSITLLQFAQGTGSTSGTATAVFTNPVQVGSTIVVEFFGAAGPTVSDGTISYTAFSAQTAAGAFYRQFAAINVAGGSGYTVTATGCGASGILAIYEYANVKSVDASSSGVNPSATSIATGTATASFPTDYVHMTGIINVQSVTITNTNSWTAIQNTSSSILVTMQSFFTTLSAAGSVSNTANFSSLGKIYAAILILKPIFNAVETINGVTGAITAVNSLNTLTGALSLVAGTGVTVVPSGSNITISASGSGTGFSPYPATLTPPASTNFSWVNQGTATATDKTNRMIVAMPDSYNSVVARFLVATAAIPAAPYTIDIGGMISETNSGGNGTMLSAAVFDSSNNSVAFAMFANPGGNTTFRSKWLASGAITGAQTSKSINATGGALFFLRITDDGTHRTFYFSQNGLDYFLYAQENTNTDVTPTHAGIQFYNNGGGTGQVSVLSIYHFLVSNSILPQFA